MTAKKRTNAIAAAIKSAGGTSLVAQRMQYATSEPVRRFIHGTRHIPAEKAMLFREAVNRSLTLAEIRPDIYAGLTVEALGYIPEDGE